MNTIGHGTEEKDSVVHFDQIIKAVCIKNDAVSKKDQSFIAGKQLD